MSKRKYTFNVEEFKNIAEQNGLIIEDVQEQPEMGVIYISFEDDKLKYIRVAKEYEGKNNCINIYHGESTKNGYWWNEKINYEDLTKDLLQYSENTEIIK